MKKWLTGLAAAGWAALLPLGASAASPVTGEDPRSPIPFILAGIGLALVIAMVVISTMSKKKQGDTPPPEGLPAEDDEAPTDNGPSGGEPPAG